MSNFILMRVGHPIVIIRKSDRQDYIMSLKQIREKGTDEYLVAFFFRVAINRMNDELLQKERNSRHTFLF